MDELTIDGKTYVSSKRAAKLSGYAKDYVGQLCREGRIESRLVGRSWYVLLDALNAHRFKDEEPHKAVEKAKIASEYPWERARYSHETPKTLPEIGSVALLNKIDPPSARDMRATDEEHAALVTQMQSAWQEWFTQKEAEAVQTPQEEEISIPVVRSEEPEEEVEQPVSITREAEDTAEEVFEDEQGSEEVPVIRITETKVTPKGSEGRKAAAPVRSPFSRWVLQGSFVLVSLAALFIALVGTEVLDPAVLAIPGADFIAGVNAIRAK